MPQIKDVSSVIDGICAEIKSIDGVTDVYGWGSFVENRSNPNFVVKDIDIIAATAFDSGDLLAIDNSRFSALRIRPTDLEDEGFSPRAVAFTRRFLSFEKYNVDHWATSCDGRLLHWGAIPDNHEEWFELHALAEKAARKATGVDRLALHTSSEQKRKEWKLAYDKYIAKSLADSASGWSQSDHDVAEILERAVKLA